MARGIQRKPCADQRVWLALLVILNWVLGQAAFAAQPNLSGIEVFDVVWEAVAESYAGPGLNTVDWQAVRDDLRPQAQNAKDAEAFYGVIDRMLSKLDDPLTYYVSPPQMAELKKSKQADDRLDIVGVGILLSQTPDGQVVAREVLPKGPAARSGIKQGVRIAAVDGQAVKGLPLGEVADRIKGEKGTKVTLSLLDPNNRRREVTMSRASVRYEAQVRSKVLSDNIGYLYLPGGGDGFETKVLGQLRKLHRTQALIVDLRSGWSILDLSHMTPMLKIAGLFTDRAIGTLLSRQGAFLLAPISKWESTSTDSWWRSLLTPPPTALDVYKKPIAFLVDESSTWEILALGMRDIGRATVVGRPTASGAGALAGGYELSDGSGISITITYYASPLGNTLNSGMQPDVYVPMDRDYLASWHRGDDPDITSAKEALLAQIAAAKGTSKK